MKIDTMENKKRKCHIPAFGPGFSACVGYSQAAPIFVQSPHVGSTRLHFTLRLLHEKHASTANPSSAVALRSSGAPCSVFRFDGRLPAHDSLMSMISVEYLWSHAVDGLISSPGGDELDRQNRTTRGLSVFYWSLLFRGLAYMPAEIGPGRTSSKPALARTIFIIHPPKPLPRSSFQSLQRYKEKPEIIPRKPSAHYLPR